MKVILAGSTGFIGHEVLDQCLANPAITSIVALSRRDIPSHEDHNKLQVVIMNDFLTYSEAVMKDLKSAEACIWSLGKAWMPDNETARRVCIDYTIAAAKALTPPPTSEGGGTSQRLRFVYLSGGAAERDQKKSLWFKQDYRRIRGQVENALIAHAMANHGSFEACIMRPGLVLAKEPSFRDVIRGLGPSVRVEKLAGAMVSVALERLESKSAIKGAVVEDGGWIFENGDINGYDGGTSFDAQAVK